MNMNYKCICLFLFLPIGATAFADDFKAGVGRKAITPDNPAWLAGYAIRTKPAEGVEHDLWAKAIAIESGKNETVVIVTTDLLGLSHEISVEVANQVKQKLGIKRSNLMFNSSHTHCGPMVWPSLSVIADYGVADQQAVSKYNQKLTADLVAVIEMALNNLKPVKLYSGMGSVGFAKNRRQKTDHGVVGGWNDSGPVDHEVPVLKFETADGNVQAVLFAYACHNTTVPGTNYRINGDYAGYAQIELEKEFPGAAAMFLMGCGGDQNPFPRGTLELAATHGKELADEVKRVLSENLKQAEPSILTAYTIVDLEFKEAEIKKFQEDLRSDNVFLQRRAKLMVEAYNKSWNVSRYPYPVQAIRLSKDITILALAGEAVVDYSILVKKIYGRKNVIVVGYSNEVMCYIPTKRILAEGGYEADQSMIYYGMKGPFKENVEEKILSAIEFVMKKTKNKRRPKSI